MSAQAPVAAADASIGFAAEIEPQTSHEPRHGMDAQAAREPRNGLEAALDARFADPQWTPAPRGWYASMLAATLPLFAIGMVASALADRLVFAGWAIAAGIVAALLLRAAWARGWSALGRAALVLGWAALALLAFAALVGRHGEVLDLGYRAVLWPIYSPVFTKALTSGLAAVVLALAAVACLVLARSRRRAGAAS